MTTSHQLVFGPFRLDRTNAVLWRDGEPVPLPPRPLALLRYLVENPGRLLPKEELVEAVWGDAFVTEAVLKVAIREVRRALADPVDAPRFIATVHGRGYRFVGDVVSNTLPARLTSFVGRKREVEAVLATLARHRLVTLVGAGGCGKTRLAVEAAALFVAEDGVWWVDLASLSDPALVPQAVASALGIREVAARPLIETLCRHFRPQASLLVLDNCEHLLATCAELAATLLEACAGLRILTTSREPLAVAGENLVEVGPLELPGPGADPAADPSACDAIRLFAERAAAVGTGFRVDRDNAAAVIAICRQLDGLPLAIELAAARVRALGVHEIVRRLDDRLRLLTAGSAAASPRHRSLHAAIAWSHQLLSAPERALWRRLGVFAGELDVPAAEAIAAGDPVPRAEVLPLLGQLVDKSLVSAREVGSRRRFRLLETMRHYAREQLAEAGETNRYQQRHSAYYLQRAEQAAAGLEGAGREMALALLELDYPDLREVLRRERAGGDVEVLLRLAAALWWFWFHSGRWSEAREWLSGALARAPSAPSAPLAAARFAAGALAWFQGRLDEGESLLRASASIWRAAGDPRRLGLALAFLGEVVAARGDAAQGLTLTREGVERLRGLPETWELGVALIDLGNVTRLAGDAERAEELYRESADVLRRLGDRWTLAMSLRNLGIVALARGDRARAIDRFQESLEELEDLDESWFVSRSLEELASAVGQQGDHRRAACLIGAGAALRETIGAPVLDIRRADYDRSAAALRETLGQDAWARALAEGRAMSRSRAIAYALRGRRGHAARSDR